MKQIIIIISIVSLLIIPAFPFVLAQGGVVPSCNTKTDATGKFTDPCGFTQLVQLANNIIKFLIKIGAVLAAISISYAGWLYITGGSDKKNEARAIFVKVFWGFVMMLAAWLIVSLVLKSLGYTGVGIDFLGNIAK